MYLGTHIRVWVRAAGIVLQFTAAPGATYAAGTELRLRLPARHTWVVPVEEPIA
jgi:hypothetical protein